MRSARTSRPRPAVASRQATAPKATRTHRRARTRVYVRVRMRSAPTWRHARAAQCGAVLSCSPRYCPRIPPPRSRICPPHKGNTPPALASMPPSRESMARSQNSGRPGSTRPSNPCQATLPLTTSIRPPNIRRWGRP
eukprot:8062573-Pyramimonas_sp.AAC.1